MIERNPHIDEEIITPDRTRIDLLRARIDGLIAYVRARPNISPNVISVVLWSLLALAAITRMDTSWDSLAYHLPFASRLWGIFPQSSYAFYSHLEPLYIGQPKLAEFMEGMLWRVTGMVSAANLFGLFCIVLLSVMTARRLKVPFWMVTLLFLSIPLVLIHSVTSMTDLPANAFIGMAFVNLVGAFDDDRFDNKKLFFVLLPLGLAANVKFQALLIAAPFFGLVLLMFLFRNRQLISQKGSPRSKYLSGFLLVSLTSALLFSSTYAVNLVRFNNPLYPLSVTIGPVSLKGPGYGLFAGEHTSAVRQIRSDVFKRYLASLSEIPLLSTRSGGPLWTVDMGVAWGAKMKGTPYFKTGGFFVANLLLWGIFLLISVAYTRTRKYVLWLLFIAGNFLFVGLLPSAILLRYWMFLPLELAVLTLWAYKNNPEHLKRLFQVVIVLQLAIFSFVAYKAGAVVFPTRSTFTHLRNGVQNLRGISRQYQLDVSSSASVCIVGDTRMGFYYKISNPEVTIRSAESDGLCGGATTIVHP